MLNIYIYIYVCVCVCVCVCVKVKVSQLCLTPCNPMDYTVHGILQARLLEWVTFPFSRGSSWPRGWTQFSLIAGRFFTNWAILYTHTHTHTHTHTVSNKRLALFQIEANPTPLVRVLEERWFEVESQLTSGGHTVLELKEIKKLWV